MGIAKLYPFECIKIETDEAKVMELFEIMRADGKNKGYTPVIIIEDEHGLMSENIRFAEEDYGSYEEFIKTSLEYYEKIDVQSFFKEKRESYEKEGLIQGKPGDMIYEESNSVYLGEKGENVFIAKIPTTKPYEVFAYIPMGGFNECPDNATHIALAKYWFEMNGAYPICIGSDTIQFMLDEPIKDKELLEKVAMEQYLYCGDIVWQGVETVKNLENSLGNSKVWYFWWD